MLNRLKKLIWGLANIWVEFHSFTGRVPLFYIMSTSFVTISEDYMRDIFDTVGDAIRQRIFLEELAGKYNAQLAELSSVKQELLMVKQELENTKKDLTVANAQLTIAHEANKIETIYAKIFLENMMANKKVDEVDMDEDDVVTDVVSDIVEKVSKTAKKRKMNSDITKGGKRGPK